MTDRTSSNKAWRSYWITWRDRRATRRAGASYGRVLATSGSWTTSDDYGPPATGSTSTRAPVFRCP